MKRWMDTRESAGLSVGNHLQDTEYRHRPQMSFRDCLLKVLNISHRMQEGKRCLVVCPVQLR
jgi:hypothetical protein